MEQIKVIIDAEGTPVISVVGVKGKSCQELTEQLERALGQTAADRKTGDYFETQTSKRSVISGQ